MKASGKAFWWSQLRFFVKPHPVLHPEAGEVYVPSGDLKITFYADGPIKITGGADDLEINFNGPDFLVLATSQRSTRRIYRILWQRLIGFELVHESDTPDESTNRYFLN